MIKGKIFKRSKFNNKSSLSKKIKLANSALLVCVAKNVKITDNKSKGIVFCGFMTRITTRLLIKLKDSVIKKLKDGKEYKLALNFGKLNRKYFSIKLAPEIDDIQEVMNQENI